MPQLGRLQRRRRVEDLLHLCRHAANCCSSPPPPRRRPAGPSRHLLHHAAEGPAARCWRRDGGQPLRFWLRRTQTSVGSELATPLFGNPNQLIIWCPRPPRTSPGALPPSRRPPARTGWRTRYGAQFSGRTRARVQRQVLYPWDPLVCGFERSRADTVTRERHLLIFEGTRSGSGYKVKTCQANCTCTKPPHALWCLRHPIARMV